MPKLTVNQIGINCVQLGDGPDVVMAHGLAASLAYWYLHVAPELAKSFRVTMYDLRGHGFSHAPADGYTTRNQAADLLGLMDSLGIEQAHLVGHSFGGAICLHLAVLHPERVRSLSLIDTRVPALQPIRGLDDERHWEQRRSALLAVGISVPERCPKIMYSMLEELADLRSGEQPGAEKPNDLPGTPGLIARQGEWNPNSRSGQRWLKLVDTTSFAEDIKESAGLTPESIRRVHVPALLSYGQKSHCLETCDGLERVLQLCRIRLHPGVGHFFPSLYPELVVRDVLDFFESLPSAVA